MISLKVKLLTDTAKLPTYAHDGDACFDLYADEDALIQHGNTIKISTGNAFDIPSGYCLKVYGRSGLGYLLAVREAWKAWQASRESMQAIKLPNAITADNRLLGDNEYCSGYNQALRGCEKQITSAGYKVE